MLKFTPPSLSSSVKWLLLSLSVGIANVDSALSLPSRPRPDVGVVISKENINQWSEISARLQSTGVNYCVLDVREWQEEQDLKALRVLFLPNVGNLTGEQALSLDSWLDRGGKAIVSGPTGKLATRETQETLKNALGAYWGFAVTKPSTLLVKDQYLATNPENLSSTLVGGVILPIDKRTDTLAVWMAENEAPAVVQNDHTTYFGWRWGVENVASAEFDTAWLKITLKEYGINTLASLHKSEVKTTIESCENAHLPRRFGSPTPSSNQNYTPNPTNSPNSSPPSPQSQEITNPLMTTETATRPLNTVKTTSQIASTSPPSGVSSQQIESMVQELESLIYRVESALITAEARKLRYTAPTSQLAEQVLQKKNKSSANQLVFSNKNAHQALLEAKHVAEKFPELARQDYAFARRTWLDARRNLWDSYPTDRHIAQPEVRAMWLDRGTIVKARSKAELTPIFDAIAEAGINTVFFETVNASYPIYPSRVAPEQNPLTRGWDPLQAAIELAHERGMELHAWVWAFAGANQGHNTILNQPQDYLGPVLSRHPDWVLKDQNGHVFNRTPGFKKAFFDPANPEVRRYLLALYSEIVANYDVDGLQLDYIRYPFQDNTTKQHFGYTDISRRLFKQSYGIDPQDIVVNSSQWRIWERFRIQQVDSFVAEVAENLKRQRPDLILSAAVFPMEHQQRLRTLQQNWEEWLYSEWVDMMVLMTYALHTGSFAERAKPVYDYSETASGLIIPGIRLLNVPETETLDQMQLMRNMPTNGFALFAAENLNPNLQSLFEKTQGTTLGLDEPIPHREPFLSAFARYQNLRKEWNFLLVNGQIKINPRYLKSWGREVDVLSDRLNQLAENPSSQNLRLAQKQLTNLRERLPQYLAEHQQENPLQLEAWQNRLLTIENLLKYGERTVLAQK